MDHPPITPEERFAAIVESLAGHPGVSPPADDAQSRKRFGSNALKIHNKIFAMLVSDRFVVKLAQGRVDALVASGEGERFDPGHGRLMKEWITVAPTAKEGWLPLAREAMAYVESSSRGEGVRRDGTENRPVG